MSPVGAGSQRIALRRICLMSALVASLAALPPGTAAAAGTEPDSGFSLLLRMQPELVHVSGSAAEARDGEGWYLTDGWSGGNRNSQNWGALFIDGHQRIAEGVTVVARLGFNVNMEGFADGRARQREVQAGIRGPLGQLLVGRLETPYKVSSLGWDPLNATFMQARANSGRSGGPFGHGSYVDRAIEYSQTWNGIGVRVFMALDDNSASDNAGGTSGRNAWSTSLSVPVGPVQLMFAHIDASRLDGGPDRRTGTKLGARYAGDDWRIGGHYEVRGRGLEHGDFLFVNAERGFGPWRLMASYGRFENDAVAGNDGRYNALGARYVVSRNFSVHGGVRRTRRDLTGTENVVGLGFRILLETGNLLAR